MLHVILMALAPVFFVMALGYVAGRRRIIDNHRVGEINALVMNYALPASLFVATASAPRGEMMAQGPVFAVLGTVMLISYSLWYQFQRRVLRTSTGDAATQAQTVAFPNFAGVGLPIASAVLGSKGVVPVAVAIAAGAILVSPLALVMLELSGCKGQRDAENSSARVPRALRKALTKPVVLAPVLGILLSLSGLHLNTVADASLALIGQAAGGVALFLTGLILSAQALRLDGKVVGAVGTADIIRPLLVVAMVLLFPIPHEIAKVSILLAAVPSGFFGILFGANYGLDSTKVGSMVVAGTVFSIAPLAIAIAVLYPQ